jgi:hypothetical protein
VHDARFASEHGAELPPRIARGFRDHHREIHDEDGAPALRVLRLQGEQVRAQTSAGKLLRNEKRGLERLIPTLLVGLESRAP